MTKLSHCHALVREECAEFMPKPGNPIYCLSQKSHKCLVYDNKRCEYFEDCVLPLASDHRGRLKQHKHHKAVYEYESFDVQGYGNAGER